MSSINFLRQTAFVMIFWIMGVGTVFGSGLPGEYLLTQRWRNMIADRSPLTNPALMTEENYLSFRGAFAPILDGAFKLFEAGATKPIGLYQSVGVTAVGELDGEIQEGYFNQGRLLYSDEVTTNYNLLGMASYAIHIWNRLSLGINTKVAIHSLDTKRTFGIIPDIGITYRVLRHSILGDHVLGMSFMNIIPIAMDDDEMYSRDLKFSWLGNIWERRIETALDFDVKDFMAYKDAFTTLDNLQNTPKIEWYVNAKAGVWLLRMFKVYAQAGIDPDVIDYVGLALGFNVPTFNNGRDLEFFVQYNLMTEDNNEADALTFSLRTDVGKHREELYARKMARMASLSPNELYNLARRLYSEKKYWDAFFVFSRITVEFPDFFKADWVNYYRSSCEEELDMRDVAIANYENTIKQYPLSGAVPHADLGLMRIYYRNGDFAKVANQYVQLSKENVPDSLRYHGAYLMGQTLLQSNDLKKAFQIFKTIPETHPDYVFAQHAIAITYARAGSDMAKIVAALENCVGAKAVTDDQKEIVYRSYLFLGYIFYEENALSKAVVALRMVPTSSYYAEDALLGQGWTALKARQWNDCITTGSLLTKTSKKPILKCEGMLIRAYGHLLQQNYHQSLSVLKDAYEMVKPLTQMSDDTLNYAKMQYESERMSFNFLAEKVENISKAGQTASITGQIDSLHGEHQQYVKQFDEYYHFSDEFKRSSFFTRNADQIRDDIEYALARVQKLAGQSGVQKKVEEATEEQQKLDAQIEKLKQEMEKLQKNAE